MKVTDMLMNIGNECNGHKRTVISGMTLEDGFEIIEELNREYEEVFVLEAWDKEDFSIYQKDFWAVGEHHLGHTDRLILSNSN